MVVVVVWCGVMWCGVSQRLRRCCDAVLQRLSSGLDSAQRRTITLNQTMRYYATLSSGAYIFRPDTNQTTPLVNSDAVIGLVDGPLVKVLFAAGNLWSQVPSAACVPLPFEFTHVSNCVCMCVAERAQLRQV